MKPYMLVIAGSLLLAAFSPISLPDQSVVNGHLLSGGGPNSAPTVGGASCGTPVLTLGSTDFAGTFQAKGTSTCAITFGKAFASTPFCIVQDATTPADSAFTFATSGTQTTGFTMGTTASNDLISWLCVGQSGG